MNIELDQQKLEQFIEILSRTNRTVNQAINMMINKTIKENSIDWLYTSINGEVRAKNIKSKKAIELFKNKGHNICNYNSNFASKNTGHNVYWLNPDKRHLLEDWYIILNDYINKRLYLLFIPKNSLQHLSMRNDRICNISITYNDLDFIDINSGVVFKDYLVDVIEYNSLLE